MGDGFFYVYKYSCLSDDGFGKITYFYILHAAVKSKLDRSITRK